MKNNIINKKEKIFEKENKDKKENKKVSQNRRELTQKDFDFIKWNIDKIKIIPDIAFISVKNKIEEIKNIKKEDRTFENTIFAFEKSDEEISDNIAAISLLEMISDKREIREAARSAVVEFSSKVVELNYDENLYKSIREYYDGNYRLEKKNSKNFSSLNKDKSLQVFDSIIGDEEEKLIEDYIRSFSRMGFDLDKNSQKKIKIIEKKINELASSYDANIAEDNSHILVNFESVKNVPEMVRNSFENIKDEKGNIKYKVTTSYPEYGPFMKYSDDRNAKKELYIKFNNVGGKENVKILEKLVTLRKEKAEILKYKNHGEFVISDRMAKKSSEAYKMLNSILKSLKKTKDAELKEIQKEGRKLNIEKVEPYDNAFIINKIKEEKYNIDDQKIREYFPLDHVMKNMFSIFGELFDFKIEKTDIKSWHKDVNIFKVIDTSKNSKSKIIGYISFDMFPREGKFSHACMMPTLHGYSMDDQNYNTPLANIICNFSKPNGKINSKNYIPSLLTLGEVETIFHEFGHALHHIFTKAKYESNSGTNVLWDFVEVPSQLLEEWLTEEKVLKKISSHYKTGKNLSKSEIEKILKANKFMKAMFYTTQSVQAILDLDIYTDKIKYLNVGSVEHYHNLMRENLFEQPKEVLFVSRFAHIARGYDAGYYSYLWAERIEKDFYSLFKNTMQKNGDRKKEYKKLGEKYRKEILEAGSSRNESESVFNFLGRDVDTKGFIEGIL